MTILRNFSILINLCSTAVDVIRKIKALKSHQLISGLIMHNSCIICGWVWSPFRFYCSLSFQCCGNTIWVLKTQKITQDHLRLKKIITEKNFLMCFLKAKKFIVLFFIAWKSDKGREKMNTLQEKEWIGLFQFKRFSSFCIWTNERACLFGNFDLKLLSSFDLYRRGQVNKAN